jgi:saccharopine dehydrogenase-like NADP-dependent oxidoreductase
MKNILVLGAGLVSRPGVTYLLQNNFNVTVAEKEISRAEKLIKGFSNGTARQILVENREELESLIDEHDIVVSLLPREYNVRIAELCIKNNRHMVTASYVSEDMKKLDKEAREKQLLFLNEIGLDPGIDHMSAMKIIDEIYGENGKVLHFYSYCGGLPAPEANDNPIGYKFSWSPRGVVLASKNPAQFLENGEIVTIESKDLFLNKRIENVDPLGKFEVYPNRNSLFYKKLYGLKDALTVLRGTCRNLGWCDMFKKITDLGLIDDTPISNVKGITFKRMMADLIGVNDNEDVYKKTADKIGIPSNHSIMKKLKWLGLFDDAPVPDCETRLDIFCELLIEKLKYNTGERDMIILRHKFTIENKDKTKDLITSTLIDYGIPNGDSSMARTVSLPLAIAVRMMCEGKIILTGIQIPVKKEIYSNILRELETLNIKIEERRFALS